MSKGQTREKPLETAALWSLLLALVRAQSDQAGVEKLDGSACSITFYCFVAVGQMCIQLRD